MEKPSARIEDHEAARAIHAARSFLSTATSREFSAHRRSSKVFRHFHQRQEEERQREEDGEDEQPSEDEEAVEEADMLKCAPALDDGCSAGAAALRPHSVVPTTEDVDVRRGPCIDHPPPLIAYDNPMMVAQGPYVRAGRRARQSLGEKPDEDLLDSVDDEKKKKYGEWNKKLYDKCTEITAMRSVREWTEKCEDVEVDGVHGCKLYDTRPKVWVLSAIGYIFCVGLPIVLLIAGVLVVFFCFCNKKKADGGAAAAGEAKASERKKESEGGADKAKEDEKKEETPKGDGGESEKKEGEEPPMHLADIAREQDDDDDDGDDEEDDE
eukprot:g11252.t1